jgi:hypothetical protein
MGSDSKFHSLLLMALLSAIGAACSSGKRPPSRSAWETLAPFFQRKDGTNALPVEAFIAGVLTPMRIGISLNHFYRVESRWPTNGQELGDLLKRNPILSASSAAGVERIITLNASDLELMKLLQFTPRSDGGLDVAWQNQRTNNSHGTLRVSAPTNSVPKPQP